jgi:hypothetical protein
MSYISNGCNDCSAVDFGMNNLYNSGGMQFLDKGRNDIGIFDNGSANQSSFPNQQQLMFQPTFQQQPQQPQQPQQVMQQPVQQQMAAPQQLVRQAPVQQQAKMQQTKPVESMVNVNQQNVSKSNSLQDIIGNYLFDNAFTLTIAFLVASAWHTTIKYYIDQAIKFNAGTPTYYIVYAVIATIVSIFLSSLKH